MASIWGQRGLRVSPHLAEGHALLTAKAADDLIQSKDKKTGPPGSLGSGYQP